MARQRGFTDMARLLEAKLASLHDASAAGDAIAEAIRSRDLPKVREGGWQPPTSGVAR